MTRSNREKLLTGELYECADEEIMTEQRAGLDAMYQFNQTDPRDIARRSALLREMLAEVGEGCFVEGQMHCNWGGKHISFGKNVYADFNLTVVDDGWVRIGDFVQIGPNVTLTTAGHPIDPELRRKGLQYNMEIDIQENAWLGAGVIVMPGVTIGANAVIGAGSVVTRDIPPNVVAVGAPCRVLREIGEHDRMYYFRDCKIDESLWSEG